VQALSKKDTPTKKKRPVLDDFIFNSPLVQIMCDPVGSF
jgi:hypothetical protein